MLPCCERKGPGLTHDRRFSAEMAMRQPAVGVGADEAVAVAAIARTRADSDHPRKLWTTATAPSVIKAVA